ncbi:MAG: hypothetical protein QGH39_05420 [Candidatus Thermoplasmatota archaeon]|nr:hypothetical protein [Candidatus Thermoplasmatota archaeon]MDP7264984.1 hypothetical protein [Candidatus Thermoplasmatota archaeon]
MKMFAESQPVDFCRKSRAQQSRWVCVVKREPEGTDSAEFFD